jgi:Ion channel
MTLLVTLFAVALIVATLWDTFETMVLPRRVTRRFRFARVFVRGLWELWLLAARRLRSRRPRESLLSLFGPLTLIMLLATWATLLVIGFGLLQAGLGSHIVGAGNSPGLGTDLYLSGTTFFTLGLGDVAPQSGMARFVTVVEAGLGFGFLAIVIGYLPVLYQTFSQREVNISQLDERAGSPPTGTELLCRSAKDSSRAEIVQLMREWERWSAELMESHLSYPILAYFRSQHEKQSWIAALTAILDACALVLAGIDDIPKRQARLTFAIARHAVVDLCGVFAIAPKLEAKDTRLPPERLAEVRQRLASAEIPLREGAEAEHKLAHARAMYEPYVLALGEHLLFDLPPWVPETDALDDWEASGWEQGTAPSID